MLKLRAALPVQGLLDAIEVLRTMNADNARLVPANAPRTFIKPRWARLVFGDAGIDRRYYELCALSQLKNALRSGDVWVQGSRQFKDFDEYLVPAEKFAAMKQVNKLPVTGATDVDQYLLGRLLLLEQQLTLVNLLAATEDQQVPSGERPKAAFKARMHGAIYPFVPS